MTLPTRNRRRSIDATNSQLERLIGWVDKLLPLGQLRPLDRIPSLKLKFSIVIGAAIAITIVAMTGGVWLGLHPLWGIALAIVAAVALVQILARGITAPLGEMMRATNEMADGGYERRVTSTAADEVGELARSFNTMAASLGDLERQHRELIETVSHELRTPVAVLRGNLENLLDDVVDDRVATLEAMLKQTERLGHLVNQVLDLARLEAGASPMHVAQMDLVALVEDAIGEASLQFPTPELELDAPRRLLIEGDADRLHQVVANLLNNAIQHGPVGEPICVAVEKAGGQVSVTVEDRGPGIPTADLDRIFERFHRVDPDIARGSGFGLGLAISKWIVELHGGTISACNHPLSGCVVRVDLPGGSDA